MKSIEEQQAEYLKEHEGNPCDYCGTGNKGSVITMEDGTEFLMHYGLWNVLFNDDGSYVERCMKCGRKVYHKR